MIWSTYPRGGPPDRSFVEAYSAASFFKSIKLSTTYPPLIHKLSTVGFYMNRLTDTDRIATAESFSECLFFLALLIKSRKLNDNRLRHKISVCGVCQHSVWHDLFFESAITLIVSCGSVFSGF
jgi:hypothetical protein